jgi:hypothetical protein
MVCILLILPVFFSCTYKNPSQVPLYGAGEGTVLYALSKEASLGSIPLEQPKKLIYALEGPRMPGENLSLEVDYCFSAAGDPVLLQTLAESYQIVLEINENAAWILPWDTAFIGRETIPERICYGVPFTGTLYTLSINFEKKDGTKTVDIRTDVQFQLISLGIIKRWYGFMYEPQGKSRLTATPFVYSDPQGILVIDPPAPFRLTGKTELHTLLEGAGSEVPQTVIEAGPLRYEWKLGGSASLGRVPQGGVLENGGTEELFIPQGAFPEELYPLRITGGTVLSAELKTPPARPFPVPIPADPGIILSYPRQSWRDRRFEVFQWDRFPSILIFDTADYAVQDRLFKRLAFFTEKAGFRGRLAPDEEIQDLHGWNAHDYRAEDLVRFFELARSTNFPLLPEERELEALLLTAGIMLRNGSGGYISGEGAVISISQESADYLRNLFMAHEGFHGLFFIDEDFRNFSRRRWDTLPSAAKRFILSYFDYQHYDMKDQYLMVNELMAHCLQQPASLASRYFGETLAARINESSWRRTVLPPQNDAGVWPELAATFSAEAAAFSGYVNRRWGLAAGRSWRVTVH